MCIRRYFKTSVTGTSYSVSGLTASTAYSFTVKRKMLQEMFQQHCKRNNYRFCWCRTSDLLFSEYIEGSSNNKALEISMLQEVL
jgi:hypothetical protein